MGPCSQPTHPRHSRAQFGGSIQLPFAFDPTHCQQRKMLTSPGRETEIHPSYPIHSRAKLGTMSKFTAVSDPATLTSCSTLKASVLRPQRTRLNMMCSNSPDRCGRCSPRAASCLRGTVIGSSWVDSKERTLCPSKKKHRKLTRKKQHPQPHLEDH